MDEVPAIVAELAKQVNGKPIAWNIKPDAVVIVFEDGRKLTFDADKPMPEEVKEIELENPTPASGRKGKRTSS